MRVRRRWIVLAVVIVLAVILRPADVHVTADQYQVLDDINIAVRTSGGPGTWTRVTDVEETDSTVAITVSSISFPFGTQNNIVWLVVPLRLSIDSRTVIDAPTGNAVARVPK